MLKNLVKFSNYLYNHWTNSFPAQNLWYSVIIRTISSCLTLNSWYWDEYRRYLVSASFSLSLIFASKTEIKLKCGAIKISVWSFACKYSIRVKVAEPENAIAYCDVELIQTRKRFRTELLLSKNLTDKFIFDFLSIIFIFLKMKNCIKKNKINFSKWSRKKGLTERERERQMDRQAD